MYCVLAVVCHIYIYLKDPPKESNNNKQQITLNELSVICWLYIYTDT
jgi:hypothetical protein